MSAGRGARRLGVVCAVLALLLAVVWWDLPGARAATGSLTGQVYRDDDDNGAQGGGEPGIAGLVVRVTGTRYSCPPAEQPACAVSRTVTTDAGGTFTVTGLESGDHTITVPRPAAYADGRITTGNGGGTVTAPNQLSYVTVIDGYASTGSLFGMRRGALTGTAWVDADSDGVIDDDEPGRLGSVAVVLLRSDETPVASTTTDGSGAYGFDGVAPGDYVVRATLPAGYGAATPTSVAFTLPAGEGGHVDFGMQKGALGDYVWLDSDEDGVQDPEENGIPGIKVELHRVFGGLVATATTNEYGRYFFVDLDEDLYYLKVYRPEGMVFSPRGRGTAATGSSVFHEDGNQQSSGNTRDVRVQVVDSGITQDMDLDAGLHHNAKDLELTSFDVDDANPVVGQEVVFTSVITNVGRAPQDGAMVHLWLPGALRATAASGVGWNGYCQVDPTVVYCYQTGTAAPGESFPPFVLRAVVDGAMTAESAYSRTGLADTSGYGAEAEEKTRANNDLYGAPMTTSTAAPVTTTTEPPVITTEPTSTTTEPPVTTTTEPPVTTTTESPVTTPPTTTPQVTDLAVSVDADTLSPDVGERVVFTTAVTNVGTTTVTGARVALTVPRGLEYELGAPRVDLGGWFCDAFGRQLSCTEPSEVAPGGSYPLLLVTAVVTEPVSPEAARAEVALFDGAPDDNPDNNGAASPMISPPAAPVTTTTLPATATAPPVTTPATTTSPPTTPAEPIATTGIAAPQPTGTTGEPAPEPPTALPARPEDPLATTGRPARLLLLAALVLMTAGATLLVTTRPAPPGRHRAPRRR
ncbi:SdrD B-like domain-containing protein [Actinosynnema pretiosum]|nr:SdrD B-like domain-containing protein [Actinosynnema pretiosum]